MRQLVSHLSGIRHYTKKKAEKEAEVETKSEAETEKKDGSKESKNKKRRNGTNSHDTQFKEFYLNEKFDSVTQALTIFKEDELLSKPGES